MSCHEDVLRIGKKLEKMVSSGTQDNATALDMLKTLKKLPMTLDVLQKTHIGMTVNNFRKANSNEEVISLSKSLIKSWKKLLPEGGAPSPAPLSRSSSTTSNTSMAKDSESQETKDKKEEASDALRTPEISEASRQMFNLAPETNDQVRLKCRELLTAALKTDPMPDECCGDPENLAAHVEDHIFKEFQDSGVKYKNRIRSRISNLKDSKNPKLRENVLIGAIPPKKLAVMSSEELSSDEMKTLRAKFTKEAIDDHQMATTGGTKTDLLKCGKCRKRNCTYNQVQTRSADEPMTTFCFCNECGNRWKFC